MFFSFFSYGKMVIYCISVCNYKITLQSLIQYVSALSFSLLNPKVVSSAVTGAAGAAEEGADVIWKSV